MLQYSNQTEMESRCHSMNGAKPESQTRGNFLTSVKGADTKQNVFMNKLKFCVVLILMCFSCETIIAQVQQTKNPTQTIVREKKVFTEADLSESQKNVIKAQRADIQKMREEAEKKEKQAKEYYKAADEMNKYDSKYKDPFSPAEDNTFTIRNKAEKLETEAKKLREEADKLESLLNASIKKAIENLNNK